MKKFINIEDNEDGTSTMVFCIDGETKDTFVIPAPFAEFVGALAPGETGLGMDQLLEVVESMIYIPDSAEHAQ